MRSLVIVCLLGSAAAADSFEAHETFGLDVATIWEPRNNDAFGAGPLLRAEMNTTKMPSWLDIVARWGILVDNADRTYAPFSIGLAARFGRPYVGVEAGLMFFRSESEMDDSMRAASTYSVNGGIRLSHWDLRTTWLRGTEFDGNVWMFSIGRDFIRSDSTVKRRFF